jgi:hypothetical protein
MFNDQGKKMVKKMINNQGSMFNVQGKKILE